MTYQWDSREYQDNEEREDWNSGAMPPAWETRYDVAQEYDKNGNRTRMHRNTVNGYETDYGNNEDLSYTFNNVNQMSAIADADDANYSCSVTCDANNNITQIEEQETDGFSTATLTTDFTYDWGNRLTEHQTSQYNQTQGDTWLTIRGHTIDAVGRTAKSGYEARWAAGLPSPPDELEHVYDRAKMLQNYDGTSSYGERWHWAGAANQHSAPLASPNSDTASQKGYNISNDKTPQRRTFTNPTSEGDQRHLYGQGKPQAKNSSGAGANWYLGEAAEASGISQVKVYSRTMFDGTVTATDMDRATDAREKGRIGIFGTGNAYAGSSGRVTSERIGRDLNPLGRGDGNAFVGGAQNYGQIAPRLPMNSSAGGWGNSVNNGCTGCGNKDVQPDKQPTVDQGPTHNSAQIQCCQCVGKICVDCHSPVGGDCEPRNCGCAPGCESSKYPLCCNDGPEYKCSEGHGKPNPYFGCERQCDGDLAPDLASAADSDVVPTAKKMAEGCLRNYSKILECEIKRYSNSGQDDLRQKSQEKLDIIFIMESALLGEWSKEKPIRYLGTPIIYGGKCKRGVFVDDPRYTCDNPVLMAFHCVDIGDDGFTEKSHSIHICPLTKEVCSLGANGNDIEYSCCVAHVLVHELFHAYLPAHPGDFVQEFTSTILDCCGCPNKSGSAGYQLKFAKKLHPELFD